MGIVAFDEDSMNFAAKGIDAQLFEYCGTLKKVEELSNGIADAIGGVFATSFQGNYDKEQKGVLNYTEKVVTEMLDVIRRNIKGGVDLAEDAVERMNNTRQVM